MKKTVTWKDERVKNLWIKLKECLLSGNPKDLNNLLAEELKDKAPFKIKVETVLKKSGLENFIRYFGVNTESDGYYESHKIDFFKLLNLLFKEIGVDTVRYIFNKMNIEFISFGDPGFPQEIIDDFNKCAAEFKAKNSSLPNNGLSEVSTDMQEVQQVDNQAQNTTTEQLNNNPASEIGANQRSIVGPMTERLTHQEEINKKIPQEEILININHNNKNLNSNTCDESNIIFVILIKLISWIYELPQWLQDTILSSTLVQTLIESVKYEAQFLEKKSNEFSLFSKDFSNIVNSGEDEIDSSIYEKLSLLASPNSDHIDMSMTSNGSKVSFYILPTDIGSNILPDYNMPGLQHDLLPLF